MTKFTIITCTYNAEAVVQRTLDSVLSQPYAAIEHIIIDGKSSDGTMALVEAYAKKNNRKHDVRVICEPDRGLYDAMNKGIRMATGDFLVFLNAGDKIAEPLFDIDTSGAAVLYGDTNIVDDNGTFLHKRRLSPPEKLSWRSFKHGMLVCHQSFYVLTDIARRTPYDTRYRFSADVDWCIRIMKEAEREGLELRNTHLTLTDYLDGGMSIKNHRASLIERFKIMTRHYGLFTTIAMHLWFVVRKK